MADSYCGVRDDHGAPHAMLDELFGIRQPPEPPELGPSRSSVDLGKMNAGLESPVVLEVPVASGVSGLQLNGGTAIGRIGSAPACIIRSHGDGKAIFLNCSFSNYGQVWDAGAAGEVLEEIASPQSVTLPHQVKGVSIGGPSEVRQGDLLSLDIKVHADGGEVGTHVIHVSVLGPPDGAGRRQERAYYARNLRAEDGRAKTTIPLAYNETPGDWTIVVKDVATGVMGRMAVTVSEDKKNGHVMGGFHRSIIGTQGLRP